MSVVRSMVRPPLRRSPHGWHQSTESRAIHRLISHGNSLRLPQCYSLSQNSPRDRCNAASSAIPLPLTQPAGAGDSGCAPCRARSPQLFLRRERCGVRRGALRGYSPARSPPQQQQQQQWGRQPEDAGQPQRRWAAHASSRPSCIYTSYTVEGANPLCVCVRVDIGIKFQCTLGRMVMLPTRPNSKT